MGKKRKEYSVTICMADGKVMTEEEFMSKPYVVEYESNKELYQEAIATLSPELLHKAKAKHDKYELTKIRRAKLEKELAELYML